ncbi:MAG: hypothetical protein HYT16_03695 [DPANN group archaeon]|nr:hypothetical protein [DPANN group archaeon]
MVRPQDIEFVQLRDPIIVQQDVAKLSENFGRGMASGADLLRDIKEKHIAIAAAKKTIAVLRQDIAEFEKFMLKDSFKHLLKEHTYALHEPDILAFKKDVIAEPDDFEAKNEQALKNLQRNLQDLKEHFGI